MAVTVRQFEISSSVCSRFKPQRVPLLPFWKMDPSLPGVMQTMVVTVQQFEISSRACSRFKTPMRSLPGLLSPFVLAEFCRMARPELSSQSWDLWGHNKIGTWHPLTAQAEGLFMSRCYNEIHGIEDLVRLDPSDVRWQISQRRRVLVAEISGRGIFWFFFLPKCPPRELPPQEHVNEGVI